MKRNRGNAFKFNCNLFRCHQYHSCFSLYTLRFVAGSYKTGLLRSLIYFWSKFCLFPCNRSRCKLYYTLEYVNSAVFRGFYFEETTPWTRETINGFFMSERNTKTSRHLSKLSSFCSSASVTCRDMWSKHTSKSLLPEHGSHFGIRKMKSLSSFYTKFQSVQVMRELNRVFCKSQTYRSIKLWAV